MQLLEFAIRWYSNRVDPVMIVAWFWSAIGRCLVHQTVRRQKLLVYFLIQVLVMLIPVSRCFTIHSLSFVSPQAGTQSLPLLDIFCHPKNKGLSGQSSVISVICMQVPLFVRFSRGNVANVLCMQTIGRPVRHKTTFVIVGVTLR